MQYAKLPFSFKRYFSSSIKNLYPYKQYLKVLWDNESQSLFSNNLILNTCSCHNFCINSKALQRSSPWSSMASNDLEINTISMSDMKHSTGPLIQIDVASKTSNFKHSVMLSTEHLKELDYTHKKNACFPSKVLWNASTIRKDEGIPSISYSDLLEDDKTLIKALESFIIYGIIIIKGASPGHNNHAESIVQKIVGRIAHTVKNTYYGDLFRVQAEKNTNNIANTNQPAYIH